MVDTDWVVTTPAEIESAEGDLELVRRFFSEHKVAEIYALEKERRSGRVWDDTRERELTRMYVEFGVEYCRMLFGLKRGDDQEVENVIRGMVLTLGFREPRFLQNLFQGPAEVVTVVDMLRQIDQDGRLGIESFGLSVYADQYLGTDLVVETRDAVLVLQLKGLTERDIRKELVRLGREHGEDTHAIREELSREIVSPLGDGVDVFWFGNKRLAGSKAIRRTLMFEESVLPASIREKGKPILKLGVAVPNSSWVDEEDRVPWIRRLSGFLDYDFMVDGVKLGGEGLVYADLMVAGLEQAIDNARKNPRKRRNNHD